MSVLGLSNDKEEVLTASIEPVMPVLYLSHW